MSSAPATDSACDSDSLRVEDADRSLGVLAWIGFSKAAFWLLVGSFLLLLASVKLHGPGMLAKHAWLTYGRIQPAGWTALVYGFAGQAGAVIGLWLVARASRQRLQAGVLSWAALGLWNVGVLAGVIGILAGYSTGREWMEMPLGALAVLVVAGGLLGAVAWFTYASRTESNPYPSAWFVLLAFLSFVWVGTVALLMFEGDTARGVVQVLLQRWFANGAARLWLGGITLAILLHALPLAAGRPLASRGLALTTFWCLTFFAPWAVAGHGDPLPRWVISAGVAGALLAGIGILAAGLNGWSTLEGRVSHVTQSLRGRLLLVAGLLYVGGGLLKLIFSLASFSKSFALTWATMGFDWAVVGAAVLAILAVAPEVFARATGRELPTGLVALNAWLSLAGVLIVTVAFVAAGVLQGLKLSGGQVPFVDALAGSMHLVRLTTLGLMALLAGQVALVLAITLAWKEQLLHGATVVRGWMAPTTGKTLGVRS